METVKSADGTVIAFDRLGDGAPVVVVAGATCDRQTIRAHAEALADHFTVLNYDRRGRGDSGDTTPYAVEREIEDIAALIGEVGGRAAVYGHSSGAALAVHAAAAGLPIDRIVVHEAPYGPDDEQSRRHSRSYAEQLGALLDQGRHGAAIELFMRLTGMPQEAVDGMRATPRWAELEAMAPTLAYDSAVMANVERGGCVPFDLLARVTAPALVLAGGDSPEWMVESARAVAGALPAGRLAVLDGAGHVAPPDVLVAAVSGFLNGRDGA